MADEFEVVAGVHFDAAHRLPGYPGPCSRLHGHRWRVEAAVAGGEPDEGGIVVDFLVLKRILGEVVAGFDHRCLNEVEPFTRLIPTSENLARHIFREFSARVGSEVGRGIRVVWVAVSESPDTRVVYRERD
ncbi:6-carboxytetrahydropterin synthase QueD [Candidatus Solincola tengchongensis]|uniref:6-carboxytetrahydropterin synthase QueD n=1 Tax=Candidatus Solincola tengchongensis TaxID=2900693 RepID=UPI00257F046D|nr:6-carboxytetrahydropterin synthase QueD [Candidatus Solincola tengchongensis]